MTPGVVTSTDPLRVRLRGDPGEVNIAVTAVAVDALEVGDKVYVGLIARQPTIFGKEGGTEVLELEPGSVTSELIAEGAVTRAKIVEEAIDAARLAQEAVTEQKIVTDAITETKIADDAITTPKIAAGQVVTDHMVAGSIEGDRIAADSIAANRIASYDITAQNASFDNALVTSLDAGVITSGTLDTETLIVDGSILQDMLAEVNVAQVDTVSTGYQSTTLGTSFHTMLDTDVAVPSWATKATVSAFLSMSFGIEDRLTYLVHELRIAGNAQPLEYGDTSAFWRDESVVDNPLIGSLSSTHARTINSPGSTITVDTRIRLATPTGAYESTSGIGYRGRITIITAFERFTE